MKYAPLRITLRPARCYVFGRRLHHGPVALLWLLSDLKDWRVWVRDFLDRGLPRKTSEVQRARCATIALCAEAHVEMIAREADALSDSAKFELAMLRRDVKGLVSALAGGIGGRPVEATREMR